MKKNNSTTKKKNSRMRTDRFCLTALINNLKEIFLIWLIIAVLNAALIIGKNLFFSETVDSVAATISFYYNGIEEGLDPNGCEFDKDSIKNDTVISQALSEMGFSEELTETVQSCIYIDSAVSTSAINNIIDYDSIYDSSNTVWMESVKDSTYRSTAYSVSFNYNQTHLNGNEAASLLNLILEKYQQYFLETYGYNESVCSSVLSVDFDSYDYLIALDMYSSKLSSVESYIDSLVSEDKTQFRSEETGYSFSDLTNSIDLICSVDVDTLTSYILNNGVISDKEVILSYYNFRLDNLERKKQSASERLESTEESIADYQKDSIIIYDGSADNAATITETSTLYDDLIQSKIQLQGEISTYDKLISDYTNRIKIINNSSAASTDAKKEYVESQLNILTEKTQVLIENVKATANDYFTTVKFNNAVSVTSEANYSMLAYFKSAVNESIRMLVITELIWITLYLFTAIAFCMKTRAKQFYKNHFKN